MHINKYVYIILVLVVFIGIIEIAQTAGWWSTSGKYTSDGTKVEATGKDPDEVKGWMTLEEVAGAYQVPLEEIYLHFKMPQDIDPTQQLKEMEAIGENFSPKELREWLKQRSD